MRRAALLAAILVVTPALAGEVTFDLVTGATPVINAWPGPDGLIGNADDLVDGAPSPVYGSAPNDGTYSFNAFDFDGTSAEPERLPVGYNAATFINGTVSIDRSVAISGGGPLLTAWTLSGTEPFPGHGPYTAEILAVNSGTYDAGTGAFTMNIDLRANLGGSLADAEDFDFSGTAFIIDEADFGTATGNTYVDDVLIPLAQAESAASLIFLAGSGIVPMGARGTFPEMPITAVIVGLSDETVPVQRVSWGEAKSRYAPE